MERTQVLEQVRHDIRDSLGRPVGLTPDTRRELSELYIETSDEIARTIGQQALFDATPDMVRVSPAPDAPMWEQGALFQVSESKQEGN